MGVAAVTACNAAALEATKAAEASSNGKPEPKRSGDRAFLLRDTQLNWLQPPSSPLTKRHGGLHSQHTLSNGSGGTVMRFSEPSFGFRRMARYRACLISRT